MQRRAKLDVPVHTGTSCFNRCSISAHSHRCICNIDCSGHNENPVCATDGNSYNNPCLVREASCMKQEQIDVKHLGRCPGRKPVTSMSIHSNQPLLHCANLFILRPKPELGINFGDASPIVPPDCMFFTADKDKGGRKDDSSSFKVLGEKFFYSNI